MATLFINDATEVTGLNKVQFALMTDVLLPLAKKSLTANEFDVFRGMAQGLLQLDLCDFSKPVFLQACNAIFKVCQENSELKSHAQELTDKLKADPRFT